MREYWRLILPAIEKSCRSLKYWQNRSTPKDTWISAKVTGASHTSWVIRTKKNETSVDLYVEGPRAKANRKYLHDFKRRLPVELRLEEDRKAGRTAAKLIRDFPGGWDSERSTQHKTVHEIAEFMASLVEATLDVVPDLPAYPYESDVGKGL